MLNKLHISNFILIEDQEIDFDQQINVLTGDTGSGKSVIVNSIRFVLGARANSDLFLNPDKEIKVTAEFELSERLRKRLIDHQFDVEDEQTVEVMRAISKSGKNKVRINGELVSVKELADIFEPLVTIYSQYSVAKFKSENSYLEIIDQYANTNRELAEYQREYTLLTEMRRNHDELVKRINLRDERVELVKMRLADLQVIDSEIDIDQLIGEKQEMEKIAESSTQNAEASEKIDQVVNGINDLMSTIVLDDHLKLLNDALINIDEISFDIAKANEPIDETRLNDISEYISTARRVARKYNVEISDLANYKQQLALELDELDSLDSDIANSESKINKQYQIAKASGLELSEKRNQVIGQFEDAVNKNLKKLSLVMSDFKIESQQVELNHRGLDDIKFTIKMNEGASYTLVHKTASGGEIARFLLAVETVISQRSNQSFIIFDEIDTGVSGHVATQMAEAMQAISSNHKLLIVTHLAQVAAISQNHFVISKATTDSITTSSATKLQTNEKPHALAKMISGKDISSDAIAHAEKLLTAINRR